MKPSVYDSLDYHALIRRIREIDRAGKDSTLARLVTADWLEEHGEAERAAFARIHVRYEAIWRDDTPERDEISELLKGRFSVTRFASPPFAPDCPRRLDPNPTEGPPRTWDWMGGWVRVVRCPLAWWLAHGPDVCRRHPVREVVITDKYPHTSWESFFIWMATQNRDGSWQPWHLPFFLFELLKSKEGRRRAPLIADLNAVALRCAEADTTPGG